MVVFASLFTTAALGNTALRYAYVTDPVGGGGQILAYSITPANGKLLPLVGACAVTPAPNNPPIAAVVDFTGEYLYTVSNVASTVSFYQINLLTGCLVLKNVYPLAPGGLGPVAVGVTPHNGCLFVSDNISGTVDAFTINGNGTLVGVPGSPFPVGPAPQGLAVDEAGGHYLYVANDVAAGTVTPMFWNPPSCQPKPILPVPTLGGFPVGVAIDPAGQFLLVTNSGTNTLVTFPIIPGGGGALGPANPLAGTGASPAGVATTPFGDMAWVADNAGNTVHTYLLNAASGAPAINGLVQPTGVKPLGVTVDWTGTYFYVVDSGAGTIHGYKPNVTTGKTPVAIGVFGAGVAPTAMAIQP